MFIAGLDVGTSGCKISVYNENGKLIENHYKEYELIHLCGTHEIDANEIIKSVENVIAKTEHTPDILGITTFGESFVLCDKNGNPLANTMLYTDPRAITSCFDADETKRIAGCIPHGMYSLPKLAWIKKNNSKLYESADFILLMQDFIGFILTGERYIDYSLAARTMGLDIRKKEWSKTLFDKAEIDIEKMSVPVEAGTVIGTSDKFGLKNTKIMVGCHDQVASAIGAGALENGVAVDGSGTVECITPVFDRLPDDLTVCDSGIAFVPYIENKYVCYAFSFTGGASLKWFKDNFENKASYRELDETISDNVGNLLVLPHFSGAATPYMDAEAKAMFANVTLETTKYDIYQGIMEGVAYEMKINTDILNEYGIVPKYMLATGGGSKSPVWLQIKADIINIPITVIDAPEVGTLGTLILAAKSVGVAQNISEAKKIFVSEGKTYYPNAQKHKIFMKKYSLYKNMYNSAKMLRYETNNTED